MDDGPPAGAAQRLLRVPRALLDQFRRLLHDSDEERRDGWRSLRRSIFEVVSLPGAARGD